ncbi:MAG: YihY/virulence factor BrkB family protein [Aquificaceae bacterium]|nr:YihY/virulence factor BrkB family protein [Aquificaceae bacterium]MDW8294079.1 YhjD/YihY/BrkB family envelope integrity protein [Aquificaceae bacterium]
MPKHLKFLFLSLLDAFKENVGYHSASLTYQFLAFIGSVFMFLGFASLYLPFLEPERVYEHLRNAIPLYADLIIAKLLPLYEKKTFGSSLSLALSYYFSISFAKSLNTAFGYIYRRKPVEGELFFWTLMPLLLFLYTSVLSLTVTLFTLGRSLFGLSYHGLTELLNPFLLFLIVLMVYASYFRLRRKVLVASLFTSLMLLLLNKLFSLLLAQLVSTSPLYGIMGTPLLFLVWLYYSFFCLLLGVCFLRRLDEPL